MSAKIQLNDEELFLIYQMLRGQQEDKKFESSPAVVQNIVNSLVYKLSDPVEDIIKAQNDDEAYQWWERKAK